MVCMPRRRVVVAQVVKRVCRDRDRDRDRVVLSIQRLRCPLVPRRTPQAMAGRLWRVFVCA